MLDKYIFLYLLSKSEKKGFYDFKNYRYFQLCLMKEKTLFFYEKNLKLRENNYFNDFFCN